MTQKPLVMIIEDEEMLLQAISKKLQIEGLETVSCSTGKQAFDYLEGIDRVPDAIWLDYYLKDMNGLEFMGGLKKNSKYSDIPVLVVSNSASEDKVSHMLALGAEKYVLKAEYRLDDIIHIIESIVEEKKKGAAS